MQKSRRGGSPKLTEQVEPILALFAAGGLSLLRSLDPF